MRKIAVMEDFLTKAHMEKLRAAAERLGFAVDFYPKNVLPDEKAGEYEVIYGNCDPGLLKKATGLKWICCSFAGVARRAKAMGAKRIVGVRRSDKPGDLCYDEMYTFSQLDRVLPQAEILVMALPSTPETVGILSRERIALLPPDAIVVNVGRGTAVDQDALMEALNAGRIAGAALDVMVPEPLPADHPLWETKNLLLTTHISGNMSLGLTCDLDVELFCEDLENYAAGRPLERLVDRKRGY